MKTLNKIWKNKWLILQGVWYSIFKKQYIEKIAKERRDICNTCPFIDLEGDKCLVPGTGPCCSKCGCSFKFKLRSLSSGCGDVSAPRWWPVMTEAKENKFIKNIKQDDL